MAIAKIEAYLETTEGPMAPVARSLVDLIDHRWPELHPHIAWGFPSWKGTGRIISVIAHAKHCNVQLFHGAKLANDYPDRIEGTGKALRHVKVRSVDDIDETLIDILKHAIELDRTEPEAVR